MAEHNEVGGPRSIPVSGYIYYNDTRSSDKGVNTIHTLYKM